MEERKWKRGTGNEELEQRNWKRGNEEEDFEAKKRRRREAERTRWRNRRQEGTRQDRVRKRKPPRPGPGPRVGPPSLASAELPLPPLPRPRPSALGQQKGRWIRRAGRCARPGSPSSVLHPPAARPIAPITVRPGPTPGPRTLAALGTIDGRSRPTLGGLARTASVLSSSHSPPLAGLAVIPLLCHWPPRQTLHPSTPPALTVVRCAWVRGRR